MSKQPYENYEKISKNFTEMCSMTETNSEHITSLISLVKSQNKSLQSLQQQVYKLQEKLEAEGECTDTEEDTENTNVQVSEIFCDLCEDRHTALYHCKDCSENLCETIAGIHKKGKATKGHLVLLLSEFKVEADVDGSYEVPIYKESYKWKKNLREYDIEEGRIAGLIAMDFSKKGELYFICVNDTRTVKVFDNKGTYLRKINTGRYISQQLQHGALRINSTDCLVLKSCDWNSHVFNYDGSFKQTTKIVRPENLIFSYNMVNSIIRENKIFLYNPNSHNIEVVDVNGAILKTFSIRLEGEFTPKIQRIEMSPKGQLFIADTGNYIVKVFSQEGIFLKKFGQFVWYDSCWGNVKFSDDGKIFILDNRYVHIFDEECRFLCKTCELSDKSLYLEWFAVNPVNGDIAVSTNLNISIFELKEKYKRVKPTENNFQFNYSMIKDFNYNTQCDILSVTFPISIKRDSNDNLFTRTLYFPQPIQVKQAIHEVEEYFRKKITKEEFNEVRSVCHFSSLQGELKGEYMNWDACKKAKVIRGYFLGGEIIDELRLDGGNLFLHITDCFVSLK
jgi:hypothetical protein